MTRSGLIHRLSIGLLSQRACVLHAAVFACAVGVAAYGAQAAPGDAEEPTMFVRLIDPGQEPRRALRLQVKPGDEQRIIFEQRLQLRMRIDPLPEPMQDASSSEISLLIEVLEPRGEDISYRATYTGVRVHDNDDMEEDVADEMREVLDDFVGMRMRVDVTDRCEVRAVEREGGALQDPIMRALHEGIVDSMRQMSLPFPVEEVGVGAEWVVDSTIEMMGARFASIFTVQVTELTETGYEATISGQVHAADQPIEFDMMPGDASARIVISIGESHGTLRHDLRQVLPLVRMRSVSDTEMVVSHEMMRTVIKQSMEMDITIRAQD